ncbi:MAG: hypothetical protein IPH51_12730 [Rubrivivax sp.]|nr:hypothetical protein [Rubrivivax sp.]
MKDTVLLEQGAAVPHVVTDRKLAPILGISVDFLQDRITAQRIPFVRLGDRCLYDVAEALAAVKAMTVEELGHGAGAGVRSDRRRTDDAPTGANGRGARGAKQSRPARLCHRYGAARNAWACADYSTAEATDEKEAARVRAIAALAGCGLYRLAGGGWLLTRWSLCRELPDLAAVGAVLRAMGVRA